MTVGLTDPGPVYWLIERVAPLGIFRAEALSSAPRSLRARWAAGGGLLR